MRICSGIGALYEGWNMPCGLGIEGLRVAVTSSSAGIGFGIASVMGECGARVTITGRREDRLKRALEELKGKGIEAYAIKSDFSVEGEAARFVRSSVKMLGGLDTLVFVPPQPPGGRFEDLDMASWKLSYRLLVESGIEAVYEALPSLKESGNPSIIITTSIAAWEPIPTIATSSVLRPALHGLTMHLSRELAKYGIRVNAIVPGYFMTDRLREVAELRAKISGSNPQDELEKLRREVPLGRIGDPREMGWAAAFLASPKASYISGAILPVTGARHQSIR